MISKSIFFIKQANVEQRNVVVTWLVAQKWDYWLIQGIVKWRKKVLTGRKDVAWWRSFAPSKWWHLDLIPMLVFVNYCRLRRVICAEWLWYYSALCKIVDRCWTSSSISIGACQGRALSFRWCYFNAVLFTRALYVKRKCGRVLSSGVGFRSCITSYQPWVVQKWSWKAGCPGWALDPANLGSPGTETRWQFFRTNSPVASCGWFS